MKRNQKAYQGAGDRPRTPRYRAAGVFLTVLASLASSTGAPATATDASAVQKQLDAAAAQYSQLETQLADTEARREKLESDLRQASRIINRKGELVRKRAGYMYKHGGATFLDNLLVAPDMGVFLRRLFFLEVLGSKDSQLVEGLEITESRADEIRERLDATLKDQRTVLKNLQDKKSELMAQFKGVQSAAKVKKFGDYGSFTLALSPSAFTDSWGARRSGGRRHKGTDVMAPCGAPVFAVTDGTVTDMHSGGLGGTMLYLRARNGDIFFYAHLRKYAPGINPGSVVKTGQIIAVNGNTGNARGGPCHVHFEWHPGGGRPVNPYPLLAAVR